MLMPMGPSSTPVASANCSSRLPLRSAPVVVVVEVEVVSGSVAARVLCSHAPHVCPSVMANLTPIAAVWLAER